MAVCHLPWVVHATRLRPSSIAAKITPAIHFRNWVSQVGSNSVKLALSTSLALALSFTGKFCFFSNFQTSILLTVHFFCSPIDYSAYLVVVNLFG